MFGLGHLHTGLDFAGLRGRILSTACCGSFCRWWPRVPGRGDSCHAQAVFLELCLMTVCLSAWVLEASHRSLERISVSCI